MEETRIGFQVGAKPEKQNYLFIYLFAMFIQAVKFFLMRAVLRQSLRNKVSGVLR